MICKVRLLCVHARICLCVHVCVFGVFESAQHNCSHAQYMYIEYGGRQSEWKGLLYLSWTILVCFTMLQVMFPMRGSISNKQDISSSKSSISTADSPANSKLLVLQEKCYHELIDVCRCIADSLGVNSSSIMNVQVKNLIHSAFSWFLPMQSLFIPEFSCLYGKTDLCYHIHVNVCVSAPQ